jgi:beta-galactosidase
MVENISEDLAWTEESSPTDAPGFIHINLRSPNKPEQSASLPTTNQPHNFPSSPEPPDWSNHRVLHRNTLPPRASFNIYSTGSDALTRDISKSKSLSLSGKWKFKLEKSPFDVDDGFVKPGYDSAEWGEIKVPGMWQLQGYGKGPQYVSPFCLLRRKKKKG